MKIVYMIFILAFISACASSGTQRLSGLPPVSETPQVLEETLAPVKLSPAQIKIVQAGVMKSLKTPGSAKFGKVVAGKSKEGPITVCGLVNAKNSNGGAAGEKPFAGILGDKNGKLVFVSPRIGFTASSQQSILTICRRRGLIL